MANTTGNKFGGRTKGTPNKLTKELRELLKNILYNEMEKIEEYLDGLEPKEKLETIIKLMPYILPKTSTISHTVNEAVNWD